MQVRVAILHLFFSHNFNDSHNKEHVINYDIALYTLQNFVEWIHNEQRVDIYYHSIKVSMTKFLQDNFIELLNLLQPFQGASFIYAY